LIGEACSRIAIEAAAYAAKRRLSAPVD